MTQRLGRLSLIGLLALVAGGCGAFNPAFVDLLSDDLSAGLANLDNAPGHVVIAFVNNAVVDERIVTYLESAEGGSLILTDAEKRSLKPLGRFRVSVTFTDESEQILEFFQGSRFVDPTYEAVSQQEFAQRDYTNSVVLCDVLRLDLADFAIEVFVPVQIDTYQYEPPTDTRPGFNRFTGSFPPQFWELQVDSEDVLRNIAPRDAPAPVDNPACGSVVTVVLEGALAVPFTVGDRPSYLEDDVFQVAGIGGRYSVRISVR